MSEGPDRTIRIACSDSLIDKYRMDQMNAKHNVTDMHLACDDGHVPVHRYLLMGLSPFLRTILETEDPSELAVIHLCGTKVAHAVQLMTLIYYGKCVVPNRRDKDNLFLIMRSLGISSKQMQFRKINDSDQTIPKVRFFRTATQEDIEMETTFVDTQSLNLALVHVGSPDIDERTTHRNKRRRVKKYPNLTPNEDGRIESANSQNILECCGCRETFQSHKELVEHVQLDCAKHYGPYYDYDNRQCLLCEKTFSEDIRIWGLLNHVVECQAGSIDATVQVVQPAETRAIQGSSKNQMGDVFINCDSEISESNSGAISPISMSSNSNKDSSKASFHVIQNQSQKPTKTLEEGISMSSNEIEIVEISDTDQMSQDISADRNIKELGKEDDDDYDELPPLVNVPSSVPVEASSIKSKQRPINKKRRRRKPLVYNPHRNRRLRALAVKNTQVPMNGQNQSQQDAHSLQSPSNSTSDSPIPVVEIEDDIIILDDKDTDSDVSTCCLIPGIDPHILRTTLGLSPSSPLTSLSVDTIHTLLVQCPLCNNEFERLKDVTKCLRYHGYRYCYACLQILPCQGQDFAQHWLNAHNISVEVDLINKEDFSAQNSHQHIYKVPCPFCSKEYEFRSALASHLGNYHCSRTSEDEIDEYSIANPRAAVQVVTANFSQKITQEEDSNKNKVITVSPGPSSSGSGSRRSNSSNPTKIVYTTKTSTTATNNNKSNRPPSNKSKDSDTEDIVICDIKSLAKGTTAPIEKKRPFESFETTQVTQPATSTTGIEVDNVAIATSSSAVRKLSTSKSPVGMSSVIFITDSGDSQSNEGIDRRSSLDTPSSMSLSEIIEDNVSSTGLSLSSAAGSPASSSTTTTTTNTSRNLVLSSKRKPSSGSDTHPIGALASASRTSSARSSPKHLNDLNSNASKSPKPRGRVSKSSSISSRGSNASNSSRKSTSSSRKQDNGNVRRLKAILGTVKVNRNDIQQPAQLSQFQYEDISPASSPSPVPPRSVSPSPLMGLTSFPPIQLPKKLQVQQAFQAILNQQQEGLEGKRSSRAANKPKRLIESDHEYEQQLNKKRRAFFHKPSSLHHSQPGSRRNSSVSVDSLENQLNQTSVPSGIPTPVNKPEKTSVIEKIFPEAAAPVVAAPTTADLDPPFLKTKAYYKDRPLHIIKAGVAPESVIISGRSTPSMASDCESNFGGGGGGPKSVGSCYVQSPLPPPASPPPPPASPLPPPPASFDSPEPEPSIPAGTAAITEETAFEAPPALPAAPEDTTDNISVTSRTSSVSSATSSNSKAKLTYLYQRTREDGVVYNVYSKIGYPSKTIHIPANEDPARNPPDSPYFE